MLVWLQLLRPGLLVQPLDGRELLRRLRERQHRIMEMSSTLASRNVEMGQLSHSLDKWRAVQDSAPGSDSPEAAISSSHSISDNNVELEVSASPTSVVTLSTPRGGAVSPGRVYLTPQQQAKLSRVSGFSIQK